MGGTIHLSSNKKPRLFVIFYLFDKMPRSIFFVVLRSDLHWSVGIKRGQHCQALVCDT